MHDKFRRLVQIWSNTAGGSFGSGYFIGNGRILTALHVLYRDGAIATKIKARPVGLVLNSPDFIEADLEWPPLETLGNPRTKDAAVIRMRKGDCPVNSEIQYGLDKEDEAKATIHAVAIGFPAFAMVDGDVRDAEQITGNIPLGSGLMTNRYHLTELHDQRDAELDRRLDWRGISGAALLCGQRVIGVLLARRSANQRYDFSGLRIEAVVNDETFQSLWVPGAKAPAPEPSPSDAHLPGVLSDVWDHLDSDLQDTFIIAADLARKQGKDYISTTTLFGAMNKLRTEPMEDMFRAMPEGAVDEPKIVISTADETAMQSIRSLSPCVTKSLSKLGPKVDLDSVLSSEDVFVDIAKNGTGNSTARLRAHGVDAGRMDKMVDDLGWQVLA